MSHFTKLDKANVVDSKAFIEAAKELGFTKVQEKATMRGYSGNTMKADVVVSKEGCNYDVGLVKNGNRFDMIADWWGVRHTVPDGENAFLRLTTKHTLIRTYRRQGFMPRVAEDENHNIQLVLSKG